VDDEISRRRENAIPGGGGRNPFHFRAAVLGTQTGTNPGWNFQQMVALQ
jgi:hypothetical protein